MTFNVAPLYGLAAAWIALSCGSKPPTADVVGAPVAAGAGAEAAVDDAAACGGGVGCTVGLAGTVVGASAAVGAAGGLEQAAASTVEVEIITNPASRKKARRERKQSITISSQSLEWIIPRSLRSASSGVGILLNEISDDLLKKPKLQSGESQHG